MPDDTPGQLKNKISKLTFYISLALALVLLLVKPFFAAGIFLGGLVSVLNFHLLYKRLLALQRSAPKGPAFFILGYFFRYILLAAVLIATVKIDIWFFSGTALGLFSLRLAILFNTYADRSSSNAGDN